jgi:hypothetical protein
VEERAAMCFIHRRAGSGLGFYHLELPEMETTRWLNISNCGVIEVRKGSISMSELEKDLSDIFCIDCLWQVN